MISARSRHLLRPAPGAGSTSTGTTPPSASSDVVGLIPDKVHEALRNAPASIGGDGVVDQYPSSAPTGHIDGTTGLACLVFPKSLPSSTSSSVVVDAIHIWRHRTQTLSENICPPERYATFCHPEQIEYGQINADNAMDGSKLVALVPYGSSSVTISAAAPASFASPQGRGRSSGGPHHAPLSSLYACTPGGTLAYWIDALPPQPQQQQQSSRTNNTSTDAMLSNQCDAAVRLALDQDEAVTCIASTASATAAPISSSNLAAAAAVPPTEPLVLIGTSSGRIMVAIRTARPLSLRARELNRVALVRNGGKGGAIGADVAGGGTGRGLLASAAEYLFTPSKPKRGGSAAATASSSSATPLGAASTSAIAEIIPLPSSPTSSSSYSNYLPSRPGSPSPTKSRRLSLPEHESSSSTAVHFLTLSNDMMLTKWQLGGNDPSVGAAAAGANAGDLREGIEWEVSLAQIVTKRVSDTTTTIAQMKTTRASVSIDGRCAAIIFLAQLQSGEVRAYLLSVDLTKMSGGNASSFEDATAGPFWLNRHPSDSLASGRWTCGGMSVVPSAAAAAAAAAGVGYVMYSAWHDPLATSVEGVAAGMESGEQGGAVATTVLLPTTGGPSSMGGGVNMCDTDLPPSVFPSILTGMVTPDLLSGGICLAGSIGCVADFRVAFPVTARDYPRARAAAAKGVVDEAEIHTVASHLLSAYLSHANAVAADDEASRQVAHGTVPPSIYAARADVLGLAVVNALARLLSIRSQPQGLHQSRQQRSQRDLFSSNGHSDAAATISFLNTHCDTTLPSFVNFLIHAGIYLRVEDRYKVKLRDVGEKMVATLALVDRWRDELALAESEEMAASTLDELTSNNVSSEINSMLNAGPVAVAERLPSLLSVLQRDILGLSLATSSGASSVSLLDITSALLCQAHTCALRFRSETSEDLFKLPVDDTNTSNSMASCAPWTSEQELLKVYEEQLHKIKAASSSSNAVGGGSRGEVHVQVLSSALLDGYRDALNHSSTTEKGVLVTSYHAAKVLSIPLLRLYDPSDVWPLDLSVDHGYFDGVFDICHDWTLGKRRFEDELDSEEKKDTDRGGTTFNLKPILEACSAAANGEAHSALYLDLLPPSIDPPSGLTFPQFVLKRYADLGLEGVVLDLGKLCPSDLATFVEEDERMADHRWIVRVRSGRYGSATDGLIDVVKDGSGVESVADRELTLSLAKLCNSLEASSSAANTVGAVKGKGQTVEDGLTLLSVQRLLLEQGLGSSNDGPMRPTELLNLVRTGIASGSTSTEESIRLLLAGLAVAEVAGRGEEEFEAAASSSHSVARYAAPIWSLAVLSDAELWQSLAAEYAAGVSGELGVRDDFEAAIETTVLYGVLKGYIDGKQDDEESKAEQLEDIAVGFYDNSEIMAGLMNELRAANAVNDANAKSLETVLNAAAGMNF